MAKPKKQTPQKRKQYTGKPGRPREITIEGGKTSERIGVERVGISTDEASPESIQRLSGRTTKATGVEILTSQSKEGSPRTEQDRR